MFRLHPRHAFSLCCTVAVLTACRPSTSTDDDDGAGDVLFDVGNPGASGSGTTTAVPPVDTFASTTMQGADTTTDGGTTATTSTTADPTTDPTDPTTDPTTDPSAGSSSSDGGSSGGPMPLGFGDCATMHQDIACIQPHELCLIDDRPPNFAVCSWFGCTTAADCPPAPPGGKAPVACTDVNGDKADNECILDCSGGQPCPTGMSCFADLLCLWPV